MNTAHTPVTPGSAAITLLAAALLSSACGAGTVRWHPSLASQVPDSTPVRFTPVESERKVAGLAFQWAGGRPRVITSSGDTVVVPQGSTLDVRLREKASHPTFGAVVGYALGIATGLMTCRAPKQYCGEENPLPLAAAGIGALIGARVKTDWWVSVRWDTASPPP